MYRRSSDRNHKPPILDPLPVLLIAILVLSCEASDSRGPSEGCEEALRASMDPWNSYAEVLDERAVQALGQVRGGQPSVGDLARSLEAQHNLIVAQRALSAAATAHVQSRVYGGDVSRNRAKEQDQEAAARRASGAFEAAMQRLTDIPAPARSSAQAVVSSCP